MQRAVVYILTTPNPVATTHNTNSEQYNISMNARISSAKRYAYSPRTTCLRDTPTLQGHRGEYTPVHCRGH